ncbi:hypothetical protein [Ideonella sp.]|uniref:hypothetical protein n=1 Tax=Ideonella sp. TaxID=1929293 RepID=UPI0037BF755F
MTLRPLLWAAASALTCSAAMAGRPMATEDAGVLEASDCELESFVGANRPAGGPTERVLSLQVGCGVGGQSQVAVAVARASADSENVRSVTLLGKTALNPKAEDTAPTFALAWALSADSARGGLKHEGTALNSVMSWPVHEKVSLHLNLGWSHSASDKQSTTTWSGGIEHHVRDDLDLTAETFGNDRDASPWVQVGLRWAVQPEKFYIDTSYGVQTGGERSKAVTLGLRWAF